VRSRHIELEHSPLEATRLLDFVNYDGGLANAPWASAADAEEPVAYPRPLPNPNPNPNANPNPHPHPHLHLHPNQVAVPPKRYHGQCNGDVRKHPKCLPGKLVVCDNCFSMVDMPNEPEIRSEIVRRIRARLANAMGGGASKCAYPYP
jgi:hypothetical protein